MPQDKFYCADLHLDHAMILRHAKRPFETVDEQLKTIISRFNERLTKGSVLYILGDTCLRNHGTVLYFLHNIVCKNVHLIFGNHDKKTKVGQLSQWASVSDIKDVTDGKDKVILCHYPMAVWNKKHHGSYHLHGHSHGNYVGTGNICDVGVDCWNFYPVTLEEVKNRIKERKVVTNV